MVAFDGSESCREAEAYYHDYLQNPNGSSVPHSVLVHIEECAICRQRVRMLREALCELDEGSPSALSQRDSQLIADLQSHFEHLDEPLACAHVRPFLCRLLSASVRIRIPTPVTVHIDQCTQCADDLDSLRQLRLGADRLARLSLLYREGGRQDPHLCLPARSHSAAVAAANLEGISAEILDHLCVCPHCRNAVYQHRQRLLDHAEREADQPGSLFCERISTAELFHCVVFYGQQPEFLQGAERRALCEHVRACSRCLERMQQIHRTVFGIAERTDSGVISVYTVDSLGRTIRQDALPASYEAYPIDVRVERCDPATAASDVGFAGRLAHRLGGPTVKPLARAAFLAVAMIPLAVLFVVSMPSASGLSVRQVDQTLASARTLHMAVFRTGKSEPIHQLWVSRGRGIVISETASERRVYDLTNRRMTVIQPGLGTVEHTNLDRSEGEAVEHSVRRILESSLLGAPLDAELSRQTAPPEPEPAGLDVYELTWDRSPDARRAPLPGRLRIYVDPVTRLPRRQEVYSWVPALNDWHIQTSLYEYPADDEIEARRRKLLSEK